MSQIILPPKHYLLSINEDVNSICEVLKKYDIVYFNCSRFFKDNSAYILTNDGPSIFNHLNKQYPIDKPSPKVFHGKKFHYFPFLDSTDVNFKQFIAYQNEFNLGHPIYFVEKYKNYTDVFVFCATPNNQNILNFYLNNIDFLEKFKFYFKDKASRLIDKANKNKIIIPKHMWSNYNDNDDIKSEKTLAVCLDIKRYILNINNQEVSLTKQEILAIQHLAAGCSCKEAANAMDISTRTVETYLNNARNKLKIRKKSELIKLITEIIS